jgi:hypothetical protein
VHLLSLLEHARGVTQGATAGLPGATKSARAGRDEISARWARRNRAVFGRDELVTFRPVVARRRVA